MFAGLAVAVAACGGGEKKADEQTTTTTPEQSAAPAAHAPAGPGATHDVDMIQDGTTYKFVPATLTIKAGDVVNFHSKSGVSHNVSFWADSIPSGAADVLKANMPDQMGPLLGPLVPEPNGVYTISFAGAPTGEYKFYCLPHLPMGMTGKITVQ
jgi:plastocyanin